MLAIIQQVDDIIVGKAMTILDVFGHVVNIVLAPPQFTGIVSDVVDLS